METFVKTKPIGRFKVNLKDPQHMTRTAERLALEALSRSLNRYVGLGKESLAQDRIIFLSALHRTAKANGGLVNANLLRDSLTDDEGNFVIDHNCYSSMFNAAQSYGNLQKVDEVPSTDARSGNRGKMLNSYKLHYFLRG